MSDTLYTLDEIYSIAAPIAKVHGVAALYLFGSYARGQATPNSDLDFRIDKGNVRTLFQLAALQQALEDRFSKSIDLCTTEMLSAEFLSSIHLEEILVYKEN